MFSINYIDIIALFFINVVFFLFVLHFSGIISCVHACLSVSQLFVSACGCVLCPCVCLFGSGSVCLLVCRSVCASVHVRASVHVCVLVQAVYVCLSMCEYSCSLGNIIVLWQ